MYHPSGCVNLRKLGEILLGKTGSQVIPAPLYKLSSPTPLPQSLGGGWSYETAVLKDFWRWNLVPGHWNISVNFIRLTEGQRAIRPGIWPIKQPAAIPDLNEFIAGKASLLSKKLALSIQGWRWRWRKRRLKFDPSWCAPFCVTCLGPWFWWCFGKGSFWVVGWDPRLGHFSWRLE